MRHDASTMQIITGSDIFSATLDPPKPDLLARADQEEQAERHQVKDQIKAAMDKINAALPDDFEAERQSVQVRQEKLLALKRKLEEIPEELASLATEEDRLQTELGTAIEDGKSLTKLTKELSAIRAKKQEVEVMQEVLEKKTLPNAEKALEKARENLSGLWAEAVGNVLDGQRNEIDQAVNALNMGILGWAYALDDACINLGLRNIRSRLDQLTFKVETADGLPGRPSAPVTKPIIHGQEERLTDFV